MKVCFVGFKSTRSVAQDSEHNCNIRQWLALHGLRAKRRFDT